MSEPLGHNRWVIADGYIPPGSIGSKRQLVSHDAMCVLNSGNQDAHIEVTIFFAGRGPVGPYRIVVAAARTKHVRFNELTEPESVPRDNAYASVIESNVPIIV